MKQKDSATLKDMIAGSTLVPVPLVFNALSALMAQQAGFQVAYVGGAALGYIRAATEAALTPHDFVDVATEIRTATQLPLIADGGCGWGDPAHMRRFIRLAIAAGYNAIEIEDQVVPKRAHHHVGVEHLVTTEAMAAKIFEATRARGDDDFMIIARTNAVRLGTDQALLRCEAYARAGADVLFPIAHRAQDLRILGKNAPLPLMLMVHPGQSLAHMGLSHQELVELNYRLLVDGVTPFVDMFSALSHSYNRLQTMSPQEDTTLGVFSAANMLVGLEELLDIERRTTECNVVISHGRFADAHQPGR